MKNILLLGRLASIVDKLTDELNDSNITLYGATNIGEAMLQLDSLPIDVVIMGGGLDDDTRAELCKLIWSKRDDLCLHIKDKASGPDSMSDFIIKVAKGFF
jgi:DNA-binding response OmpR family regulator